MKGALVFLVLVVVLAITAPLSAALRPDDQRLARKLSLRLEDFDSGWRIARTPSTKFRRISCSSAPPLQRSITGFSDSAVFRRVDDSDPREAQSTTRVFPTKAASVQWFSWSAGGQQARCAAAIDAKAWKDAGYTVSPPRVTRQSFRASCRPCPEHKLGAWSIRFEVSKPGNSFTVFQDWVAVRLDRAVIGFAFYDADAQFAGSQSLVGNVLERA